MTGFGRAAAQQGSRRLVVEVRTVNHRSVDIKIRGRDVDAACEVEILRAVKETVERGAVTVSLREDVVSAAAVDPDRVRSLHAVLESVRAQLQIARPVDLETIAAFLRTEGGGGRGEGSHEAGSTATWSWNVIRPAVQEALRELRAMRAREGALLVADLKVRLTRMRELQLAIAGKAAMKRGMTAAYWDVGSCLGPNTLKYRSTTVSTPKARA